MSGLLAGTTLAFDRPVWLLLALAAPLSFLALRFSLADFPRRQLLLQAALRAAVLCGIAAALAGPTLERAARSVSAVALVDVSDSVSDEGLAFARDTTAALTRAAAARGAPAPRVVRFAARPEEVAPDGAHGISPTLARFAAPDGAATDLALALGLGAGLADATAIPRLLLLSDGRPTHGDAVAAAARLAGRLPVFSVPLPAPTTGDAAVVAIDAPDDVRPRVPFKLDVRLAADRAAAATLRLTGDAHVTIDDAERTLDLTPGTTTASFTARVTEPGISTFRAHLAAAGDRRPANDEGVLAVATERDPRALLLEGAPNAAASLAGALAADRIATDVRPARAAARELGDLARYDLVVLADVPRAHLPDATLAAVESFVRQGGGLFVGGGTQSFGPGGYLGTRLEGMLPVRLDIPDRREEASLALALVIDRSGSMSGPKMDLTKEAARATAETLPASDQIAVIVFDSLATPVVRLQRAANRQRILGDIARIQASGGTNIFAGMREAVDELVAARARKKHIILLSDGQSPYEEIPDLIDSAAAARITVSAVGVGDGADQTLLKMIATRGGGRFYHTRDPASIPRIFSRETSELGDQSIVDRPTAVRVVKRVAALAGVPLESAPPVGGYVVTRPRPQAELVLATGDGSPLLARWPLGLGQVVAWTSDLGPRWTAALSRWPPSGKLWSQLARAATRRRAAGHFPIRATRTGDAVRVAVDAVGPDDRFLEGLDATVEVTAVAPGPVAPGARPVPSRTLPLPETAPGRYETTFRPDVDAGALLFAATLRDGPGGLPVADATGRLTLPFAPELMPATLGAEDGATLLATVAARSGGRLIHDPAELLDPGPDHRVTRQPLRTPVLLVVLFLFVVDVAARRLRLPSRRH